MSEASPIDRLRAQRAQIEKLRKSTRTLREQVDKPNRPAPPARLGLAGAPALTRGSVRLPAGSEQAQVEKNRQQLATDEQELRRRQVELLRETRDFMVELRTSFDVFRRGRSDHGHAPWVQQIAFYEAKLHLLQGMSDVFTELDDLHFYRSLKTDIEVFIKEQNQSGLSGRSPLAETLLQLQRLEAAAIELEKLRQQCIQLVADSEKPPEWKSLTRSGLEVALQSVTRCQSELTASSSRHAAGWRAEDWTPSHDLEPLLLTLVRLARPDSPLLSMPRVTVHQFLTDHCGVRTKAGKSLLKARAVYEQLLRLHDDHQRAVGNAYQLARSGNFLQALEVLQEMERLFADIDYEAVENKCAAAQHPLKRLNTDFSELKSYANRVVAASHHRGYVAHKVWRLNAEHAERRRRFSNFQRTLAELSDQAAALPECDLKNSTLALAATITDATAQLRIQTDEATHRETRRAIKQLTGTAALFVFIVSGSLVLIQQLQQRAARDWSNVWDTARAAAEAGRYDETRAQLEAYLRRHPGGAHAVEAREFLNNTMPRMRADAAWQAIVRATRVAQPDYRNVVAAAIRYQHDFPGSARVAEAGALAESWREKAAEQAWEETRNAVEKAGEDYTAALAIVDQYLKTSPVGDWSNIAIQLRQQLDEARSAAAARDVESIAEQARQAEQRREWAEARRLWEQVLKRDPVHDAATTALQQPVYWPAGTQLHTYNAHSRGVRTVAFCSNGRRIASAGDDGAVLLWGLDSNEPVNTLKSQRDPVHTVVFSPDGKFLVSVGYDARARLWDAASGDLLRASTGMSKTIQTICYSGDGRLMAVAGWDPMIYVWDSATGSEVRRIAHLTAVVYALAFNHDGTMLVAGGSDGVVRVWKQGSNQPAEWRGHADIVNSVALSPDGTMVLSASQDKTVRVWSVATGQEVRSFPGHTAAVQSVAFTPTGRYAVSGGADNTVRMWDVNTSQEVRRFEGHQDAVTSVAVSPDGLCVVSGSLDKAVRLWKLWDEDKSGPQ